MIEEIKRQFTSVQILVTLLIAAVGIYLLQIVWQVLGNFSDVFGIVICAWLVSFILEPAVDSTKHITKLPRILSALIVYLLFLGFMSATIVFFIPAVTTQFQSLTIILPHYLASSPTFINKLGDLANSSLNNSLVLVPSVANFFFSIFLVLIISFYFVIDKTHIQEELLNILPKKWHKEVLFIQDTIDVTFASFVRVQLLFGFLAGVSTWIILTIFGVGFAASTSLLAGVLTTVPLLGPVLGIIPPVFVSIVTDPSKALFVFLIILIIQQILFNIIGPKLMGKAFKMHPVIVILSFLVGLKIAGGIGAILGVPVLSIILVVIHRISKHFLNPSQEQ